MHSGFTLVNLNDLQHALDVLQVSPLLIALAPFAQLGRRNDFEDDFWMFAAPNGYVWNASRVALLAARGCTAANLDAAAAGMPA